jgi:hypothetical protein
LRTFSSVLILAAAALLAACGDDESTSSNPEQTTTEARTPATTVTTVEAKPPQGPLVRTTWGAVSIPGSICGASQPIELRKGTAVVSSSRWPRVPKVTVISGWDGVSYGDLDGDGRDEAALGVSCTNGGGTAGGALSYARVVFGGTARSPRVIGVVTPQQRQSRRTLPTLLQVELDAGRISAREAWYSPKDGTCCPSGMSKTTWRFSSDQGLSPARTVVTRPATQ